MKKLSEGEPVIRYGDIGDKYYILKSGIVFVKVYEPGTDPNDP